MAKIPENIVDKIGQNLSIGDIVVIPDGNSNLMIGRILRFTPKMAEVEGISGKVNWRGTALKRHNELVSINEMEQTVMYLMTQGL